MTSISTPDSVAPVHEPVLKPVLSPRFALGLQHVALVGILAILLVLLNLMPLRNTDIWSHVDYGDWIVDHRALPAAEPWMPLAEGMPLVDSAWGSQVIFALVNGWAGPAGLSNLFAAIVTLTYLILARTIYLQTRSAGLTAVGLLVALGVGWSRLATIRPEIFAVFGFAVVLWLLCGAGWMGSVDPASVPRWRRALVWFATPLVFLAWANLHGSFACGLALLVALCAGRIALVGWKTCSLPSVFADPGVRQAIVLFELSAAATLANPYGIDLWINVCTFSANPNVHDLLEWMPMVLTGVGGREFVAACVLLMVVLRFSRRPFGAGDIAALALFAFAALAQIRMLGWFAPLLAVVLAPHLADIWNQWRGSRPEKPASEAEPVPADEALPPGRSWRYSLVCMMIVWIAFAFSGLSKPLLGGKPRSEESLLGDTTPAGVARYLKEHPPQGQIFNPEWWGDWLVHAGPPGLKPFVTTHVHMLPASVWRDYRRITLAEAGWEAALDRYGIRTMVIDKKNQTTLASLMRRRSDWRLNYEDDQALVISRRMPSPGAAEPPAGATAASAQSPAGG